MGVECREVNIKNRSEIQNNFADVGRVYHLAAAYRTEHADQDEFRLVNVEATRSLLQAAKQQKVNRFVHCSTVGVQGKIEAPPADEEYRFNPGDHYQVTKLEGELLARKYFEEGLSGAVFRPADIYGPGDMRFLKLFRAINAGYFVMIGSGKALYHMTYIDDLMEGIVRVGRRHQALGKVFTIVGTRYTTNRELVDLVAEVLHKPRPRLRIPFYPVFAAAVLCDKVKKFGITPPLNPRHIEFFRHDRAFTTAKAQKLLGFGPKVDLHEGLARTASWYREQRLNLSKDAVRKPGSNRQGEIWFNECRQRHILALCWRLEHSERVPGATGRTGGDFGQVTAGNSFRIVRGRLPSKFYIAPPGRSRKCNPSPRLPVRFPGPRSMMYRKYLRLANPRTPFQAPQRPVLKFAAQNSCVDIHISRVSSSAVHIDRMNLRNFATQSDGKHVV